MPNDERNNVPDTCLDSRDCALCVIDIQEKLLPHIANHDEVVSGSRALIEAAKLLEVPILLTEQYPQGLGSTVDEVAENLSDTQAKDKTTFGCFGCDDFAAELEVLNCHTLVLCGIETHVCVMQTALHALNAGYKVVVVADAVGSRSETNRHLAIERLRLAGVIIVSIEMLLMEWLQDARHPKFKDLLKLIK